MASRQRSESQRARARRKKQARKVLDWRMDQHQWAYLHTEHAFRGSILNVAMEAHHRDPKGLDLFYSSRRIGYHAGVLFRLREEIYEACHVRDDKNRIVDLAHPARELRCRWGRCLPPHLQRNT